MAITYGVVSWLIIQIATSTFPYLNIPDWCITFVIWAVIIGFPIALVLAWAFEMSPEGIIRTTSETANENPLPDYKKKPLTSKVLISILLLLVIGQFVYNRYWTGDDVDVTKLEKSIAVLPFKNMSSNEENQYFCDGMMEAILNHLSKIPELRVVSRTSVEQYRNNPPPITTIGEELDVSYVVEGSVQRIENQALITVQLIDARNDNRMWGHDFDRDLS